MRVRARASRRSGRSVAFASAFASARAGRDSVEARRERFGTSTCGRIEVARCLAETLSPDAVARAEAQRAIERMGGEPGFAETLASIALRGVEGAVVDISTRQAERGAAEETRARTLERAG